MHRKNTIASIVDPTPHIFHHQSLLQGKEQAELAWAVITPGCIASNLVLGNDTYKNKPTSCLLVCLQTLARFNGANALCSTTTEHFIRARCFTFQSRERFTQAAGTKSVTRSMQSNAMHAQLFHTGPLDLIKASS